ncbi:unnamed protein product [Microthlaspi erraticum]|uniref:Arabidopsis retrotransposon Orf1 C-terminal domain-containing protein n=1 Tax=Microthlaspi erraticum TaxID=1685480 RepID=A0A6D2IUD0_9BRAS|nr:unnamed protein product [Microthlaspi erraticum]
MEEAEEEQEEDELPMYQEHYNALFSMDFVETKYPHDDTMRDLGSLRMWSWCSRTCNWGSSSLTAWSLTRSLTCEFLASMKHHEFDELDRAELDQGWGSLHGNQAHHLTHKDGKKIRGDRAHTGNLMPLLEQLQAYKVTAWMDIKFCKTNLSLSTRSWMGDSNSSSPPHGWTPPSFFCPTLSSPRS